MSLLQSKAVHGIGGFILMGGWAFFANRAYEMPVPLLAGIVQGLLTAAITVFLKGIIEGIFHRTSRWQRMFLTPFAAFFISVVLLSVIHTLPGTPAVLATISIPISVSTLYAILYTAMLSRNA